MNLQPLLLLENAQKSLYKIYYFKNGFFANFKTKKILING